jgi:predicted NBD/HSP70 family sugar kinase
MPLSGPGEILRLIRAGAVATRRDIGDATGLSRVTVSQRVEALRSARLIYESGPQESTGGRRPSRLSVNHDHGLVLTAVLDTRHAALAASNLGSDVLARAHRPIHVADGPAMVLDEVLDGFKEILAEVGSSRRELPDRVDGIGVSLPGPIDPRTSRPSQPPLMPGWDGYDVGGHLRRDRDVPVVVENDANATALGEWVSHHSQASPMCLVKVSTGIGCGIVVRGELLTGMDGGAGDVGHIRLDGHDDAICTCGSRGCLAAVASGRAIAAKLSAAGVPAASGSDVGRLLAVGDVLAAQLTREAGRLIGRVASMLVSVVNPEVLVVTGDLASPPLLAGIQESIHEFSLPRATRNLHVTTGGLGGNAAQVGLTRMVADTVLAPEAVDRLVENGG